MELSERTRERVERLVEEGTFPSVEDALDAAVELLDADFRWATHEEIAVLAERGRADFAAGRVRSGEEVSRMLRAVLESKQSHSTGQ